MKLLKRLLVIVLVLLLAVVVAAAVGYLLLRGRPGFYRTYTWDSAQRSIVNQRAVEKLTLAQNLAARAQAGEQRATTSPASKGDSATAPPEPLTLTFTEEELNAFLLHNVEASPDFKQRYEQYVKDVGIFIEDGQIILAAEVKEFGSVISLHFAPRIDEQGRLHMPLVKSLGGRLPLPTAFMSGYVDKIRNALLARLPEWQRSARMDRTGRSNTSAVAAAASKLLLGALSSRPTDAVLFMPIADGNRSVPLRLTDVRAGDDELTLRVQAMNHAEREMVLESIRRPLDAGPASERR